MNADPYISTFHSLIDDAHINRFNKDLLKMSETTAHIAFVYESVQFFRIYKMKTINRIGIKKTDGQWENIDLQNENELSLHKEKIIEILTYIIGKANDDMFDCCSRYMDCSKAGKCVNPYHELERNCTYKRKLEQGIVFFH